MGGPTLARRRINAIGRHVKPEAYAMLAARQQTYWWHRARRLMSLELLRRFGLKPACRWLDVGCGPGTNLTMLDALRPSLTVGVDLSPIGLDFARQSAPAARLVRTDLKEALPFADASFDLVTIFNVLYHRWMPSEEAVLSEVFRILRPGGLLLMTEPALPSLAREMDELTMGRRRYNLADIRALCRRARLDLLLDSYFTSFGVPALLAIKLVSRLFRQKHRALNNDAADMKPLTRLPNAALFGLAHLEGALVVAGMRMPFGVTLVCLARRPTEVPNAPDRPGGSPENRRTTLPAGA
jgi:SAM-dependent methyltransferase